MNRVISLLTLLLLPFYGNAQTTWIIDPSHSTVEFEVSHLTVSSVTGYFTSFSGLIESKNDNDFIDSKITATIQVASLTTNNLERDKHLKEDDFFNASKFPEIHFKSTDFKKNGNGNYILSGLLTIRDVTKPIDLQVDFGGVVALDDKKRAGFNATGSINRFDFGLKWDDVLDSGGLIVGEKVNIILKIAATKQ